MSEAMVRTQIYLPRDLYQALKERADVEGVSMAGHIREAIAIYLADDKEEEPIGGIPADDLIWQLIGMGESGIEDASVNHDKYIYRRDWDMGEDEA